MKNSKLQKIQNFVATWLLLAAVALGVALSPQSASATAYSLSTLTTGGSWANTAIWNPNGNPGASSTDTAILPLGTLAGAWSISLNTSPTLAGLTVTNIGAFGVTINPGLPANSTLTLHGATPAFTNNVLAGQTLTIAAPLGLDAISTVFTNLGTGNLTISTPTNSFFANLYPSGSLGSATTLTINNVYTNLPPLTQLKLGAGQLTLALVGAATNTFFTNQNGGSLGGNGFLQISGVSKFSSAAGTAQILTNNGTGLATGVSTNTLELDLDGTTPSAFFGANSFGGLWAATGKQGLTTIRFIRGTNTLASSVHIDTSANGTANIVNFLGNGGTAASAVIGGGTWNVSGNLYFSGGTTLNIDANMGSFTNGSTLTAGSGNSQQNFSAGNNTINLNPGSTVPVSLNAVTLNSQGGSVGIFNVLSGSVTNKGSFALGGTGHGNDNSSSYLNITNGVLALTNANGLVMSPITTPGTPGAKEYSYLTITNSGVLSIAASSSFKAGNITVLDTNAILHSESYIYLGGGTLQLGVPVARQAVNTMTNPATTALVQFYFNGGTLQAIANLPQVFTGFGTVNSSNDAVYVASGGAVINNGGFSVGISNNLLQASGSTGGLTTLGSGTLSLSGSNNFTGPTYVAGGTLIISNQYALQNSVLNYTNGTAQFGNSGTAYTLGGLAGTVNLGLVNMGSTAVTLTVGANNSSATYAGVLSDVGNLTKIGTGTQTFNNANTYSGITTVSNGTLAVSSAQSGGGAFVVNDGANLNVTRNATVTSLNLSGSSLTLGSVNGATNTFTCSSGNPAGEMITVDTLTLNGVNALAVAGINFSVGQFPLIKYTTQAGSGSISATPFSLPTGVRATISNNTANASYDLVISEAPPLMLTWQGNVDANWNTALNWTNVTGAATYADGAPVTLDDTAAIANTSITLPGTYQPLSVSVNNTVDTYMLSGAGSLSGTMSLTKSGAAPLILAETNTYTGATTINGGMLVVTNGGALTSPAATLNVQTGALTITTNASVTVATLLVTNNTVTAINSAFNFFGGTLTTSNTLTGLAASIIASASSNSVYNINGSWTMNGGTNLVTTLWAGGGTVGIVNVGTNVNNLTASVNPNAVLRLGTSATAANNLTLNIGNNATNDLLIVNGGLVTNVASVSIGAGSTESYNGLLVTNGGLCYIGGQSTENGTGAYLTVAGTNAAGQRATYDQNGSQLYYGTTTVGAGGTIQNLAYNLGNNNSLIVTNGGQAKLTGSLTLGRFGGNGSSILVGGIDPATGLPAALTSNGQTLTIGGGDATVASTKNNFMVVGTGGQVLWSAGAINVGPAPGTGIEQGVGNYLLITNGGYVSNSAASYIGGNTNAVGNYVSIGGVFGTTNATWNLGNKTLTIGNSTAVPSLAKSNYLALSTGGILTNVASVILGGVSNNLYFNGGTLYAGSNTNLLQTNATSLNSYGVVQSGGANINSAGLNVTNTSSLVHDPALGATADGGLNKSGAGLVVLNGNNTYTGPTTISAGTLALAGGGSISNSALITVASGAIFDVSGLISTLTLGSSQTLSNSASATGILAGNLDAGAGTNSVSFTAGTPAFTVTNGTLTLPITSTFLVNNTGLALTNGSYKLIAKTTGGAVAGALTNVTVSGSGLAPSSTASLTNISSELYLVVITTSSTAPVLNYTSTGGGTSLQFSWSGSGFKLQSQTNSLSTGLSSTGWGDYPGGASSPVTVSVDPSLGSVFFRLSQ